MHTIGERLKQARTAAGMSQRQLADLAAPLTAMAISNYENGRFTPGSEVLLRLAKALNVRFEYFFRPVSVVLSLAQYRRGMHLGAKARRAVEGRVAEEVERCLAIEAVFGEQPPARPLPTRATVRSPEEAEAAADALRASWSLGQEPISDLCEVLEEHGILVVLLDRSDSEFDGLRCWANRNVPVIAIGKDKPGDRQRFTLAHELGHQVLGLDESDESEALANRFAGAFLVPREAVLREFGARRGHLSIAELHLAKHKWGLSMQAWFHRLQEAGVISDSTYRRARKRFDEEGWRVTEPGDAYPRVETRRLVRLVERALAEDLISRSRASELLGQPLSVARGVWPQGLEVGVI
jgi:Zn-dependent peptidase ImmA (M78 family)/transcriptional regulator with XRE-family HTH domain